MGGRAIDDDRPSSKYLISNCNDRVYSFTTISSLSVIEFPKIERGKLNSVQKSDSFSFFTVILVISFYLY